jgi:aspartate/methionine/tyrosine aminotransferase
MFSSRTAWQTTTNTLTQAVEEYRRRGLPVIDLAASNPTEVALDYDQGAILAAFQQPKALEYHPDPRGLLSAREAVAAYYAGRDSHALLLDPSQIILTTSTSEAYSFLFRLLCNPDDEVLVPAPSYPLFQFLADLNDIRLIQYPLFYDHGWHIDFVALEKKITPRTRALLVVHPNNPTGSYVKAEEVAALSQLCAAREMALISDEVFLDYPHAGPAPKSFVANQEALTFTLGGISKLCGLPQMKLAWLIASGPEALTTAALARLEIIADTYLSLNTPLQLAAPALIAQHSSMRSQLLERIQSNLVELDRQLSGQSLCRRLEVEGGWYVILRVPSTRPDEELAVALLRNCGLLVHPGHFYDFPRDGFLVVSLIAPAAAFAQGIRRILGEIPKLTA